jgi:hypothetical protein
MEQLKKHEAFKRAVAAFGEWRAWGRAQHLAYGLIRGVPYVTMERCSNDNPHYGVATALRKLGAWPDGVFTQEQVREVEALIVWVRKVPRGPRVRVSNRATEATAS